MAKIITVWGSPGSGKTMFCCTLAMEIAQRNKKVLLISADQMIPMLPVLAPAQKAKKETSISTLFFANQINKVFVANAIHIQKEYPLIGIMGYCADEIPTDILWPGMQRIHNILELAGELVEYIIWDCTSNLENCMNTAMIAYADFVLRILSPDLKGIQYYQNSQKLLQAEQYHFFEHITLAGMVRPYHAIEEMSYLVGKLDGILPFRKEMDRCAVEGDFFGAYGQCHEKYKEVLEEMADSIETLESNSSKKEGDTYDLP